MMMWGLGMFGVVRAHFLFPFVALIHAIGASTRGPHFCVSLTHEMSTDATDEAILDTATGFWWWRWYIIFALGWWIGCCMERGGYCDHYATDDGGVCDKMFEGWYIHGEPH